MIQRLIDILILKLVEKRFDVNFWRKPYRQVHPEDYDGVTPENLGIDMVSLDSTKSEMMLELWNRR